MIYRFSQAILCLTTFVLAFFRCFCLLKFVKGFFFTFVFCILSLIVRDHLFCNKNNLSFACIDLYSHFFVLLILFRFANFLFLIPLVFSDLSLFEINVGLYQLVTFFFTRLCFAWFDWFLHLLVLCLFLFLFFLLVLEIAVELVELVYNNLIYTFKTFF